MRRIAAVVLLVVVTAGCGGSTEGLFGADLYEQACAACHGSDGAGGTGPAVGAGTNSVDLSDEQIAGVIVVGPGSMPAFSRFTDEQVDSLVAWIRDLQTE
jgi:mono/diheme cytochrome c family protein